MEAVGGGGGVLVSNNCFLQQNIQHHFWNFILMIQCKLYARGGGGGGGGGSQEREVADGADVVFTDTVNFVPPVALTVRDSHVAYVATTIYSRNVL